jgi:signal transduction histidine kinase
MKKIQYFFEWPVKHILWQETNMITRSRLRMFSYGLMLQLVATAIIIVSLYVHQHQLQAGRSLLLYVILMIIVTLTKLNIIAWLVMVHFSLISMTVIIWTNIFFFDGDINLVSSQFVFLVFIYANYLLDKCGRFIYPIVSIFPVIVFTFFEQDIRPYLSFRQSPVDDLSYFTIVINNFAFIFCTQYYFSNTFTRSVDKLQTSRKELGMQVLFQKRLIAGISHDIKSPLKYLAITIRGIFRRAEAENSPWIDDLSDAYKSSFQVYHFTENLLQYAGVYLENAEIHLTLVNLHELINEKIDIFSDMARAQECKVYNNVDKKTQVLTSKSSLTVIIHNLMENAIKYTSKGSVTFMAWPGTNEFIIRINDTGRGMEPELLAWCNRAKEKDSFPPHQGLGLIIVNQLLRKIDGEMEVVNMPVAGTSIQMTLPVSKVTSWRR